MHAFFTVVPVGKWPSWATTWTPAEPTTWALETGPLDSEDITTTPDVEDRPKAPDDVKVPGPDLPAEPDDGAGEVPAGTPTTDTEDAR